MAKKSNHTIEIENLLKRVKRFEPVAQRELYDYLVLPMYNTVFRILKNRDDTQDCMQTGFSIIFKKIEQYDPGKGAFFSWATRIFINESLSILRKKKMNFLDIDDVVHLEVHSNSPLEDLQAEDIMKLVNSLPDQMRIIFNLYEIEGYSHKEISQMLGIGESSSRTYLTRAKAKLRQLLKPTPTFENEFCTPKRSEG